MLWWISFFNYADRQAIFAMFKPIGEELGLQPDEKGLLGSSFSIVYGLGALFAGLAVDQIRRKRAILGGLQIWSIICIATGYARNLNQLLFFRAAEGLGETFYYPASTSLLSDYHGKATRSRALGLHQTSVYVGTIAGSFVAAFIAQHYGWRSSFKIFGGLGMILGVVLYFTLREPPRGASEEGGPPVQQRMPWRDALYLILRTPALFLFMLAFAFANYGATVLLAWMAEYVGTKFDLRLDWAGLGAAGPSQMASLVGAPLGGWLADSWRARRSDGRALVQALAVFACAPCMYFCGHTDSIFLFFAFLTGWGLFKGFYDANIFAAVFDIVPPTARGTVAGFMNTFGWLLGGAAGPYIVGKLAMRFEAGGSGGAGALGHAIGISAVVYIVAGCFLLLAARFLTGQKK